ncbi:MAG: gliding motility-associated-like protein, partial [Urechidicola sp.]
TSYEWLDVDGQLVSAEEIAQITLSFNYNQFILRVSNGVCESLDTLSFIVHPLPLVDAGEDQDAFPNEEVEIGGDPSAPSAVSFSWSPGEALSDSTLSNPTYLTVGTQEFVLTITDENNCENRDSVIINLINQVEIPDGFSPNGDGINDAWTINNSDKFPNMVVKIYSRWGNKLFESNGYETAWTGMYDKKEMPVGTYYYTIDLRDPFFPKPFTGPLTIFR